MLLVWMFISSYTINHIFVKNFMFSNVYISVNTIFEGLYMFLVENGAINWWRDPKCVQLRRKGGGVMPHAYVRTYTSTLTAISFHSFYSSLVLLCLVLYVGTYLYSEKRCLSRTVIFLLQDQFLSSWNKLFLLEIVFANQSQPKLF